MSKYVRIEDGEVIECLDYLPANHVGDWRQAIDVSPNITPHRQMIDGHSFDLTKNPVEIVWRVVDVSVDQRKEMILSELDQKSFQIVHDELIKEFNGVSSNFDMVQAAILTYREKKAEINALKSHEEIDQFMIDNQ
jgi:hypothetical protein